jgi:serine protease AprX
MLGFLLAGVVGVGGQSPILDISQTKLGTVVRVDNGAAIRVTPAQVQKPRLIQIPGSNQLLALWEERTKAGSTPYYAILPDGRTAARVTPTSYDIKLRYAEFDPTSRVPSVPASLAATPQNNVYIVQFATQPLQEFRDAITAAGGEITYYLAEHSYIVRMDATARQQVESLPFVRWVGNYEPAYRLESFLRQGLESGTLPTLGYNIQLFDNRPESKSEMSFMIRALGGTVINDTDGSFFVYATLSPSQLRQLVRTNQVFWIDRYSGNGEADMNNARWMGGGDTLETATSWTGQGVRGQVRDLGVRATHQAFASRLTIRTNSGDTSHGTNTTGIVFGNGTGNATGRGMLPSAIAFFYATWNSAGRLTQTQQLLQSPYFGMFESNSGGGTLTTQYASDSFLMDDILWRMNLIITQSQSNTNNQSSRPQAWAKNIVSIGGINHFNDQNVANDSWGGASIGPAADGRIKPDLASFYDSITCPANGSDTSYTTGFGGTSGATPIVAGHFGLLYQMWGEGIFGQTVTGADTFERRMQWATAKGIMINQANQWNFSGVAHNLTRTHQGWGHPQVKNIYDNRNNMLIVDQTDLLQNLQTTTYRVFVPSGTPAFKATMVYKDPPGTTSSTLHRINDLTLKVTAPDSTVYYGNNGLLAGMWSTSGGAPNTIDTVENVFVQNPAGGVWTVEVRADQIVQDGELSTGIIDSGYGLVVSGVVPSIMVSSHSSGPGSFVSGSLVDLHTSNNQRMRFGPQILGGSSGNPGPIVEVVGTSPTASLNGLALRIENQPTRPSTVLQVRFFNYSTNQWDLMNSATLPTTENVFVAQTNAGSQYVNAGNGEVKARLSFFPFQIGSGASTYVDLDQVRWFITP